MSTRYPTASVVRLGQLIVLDDGTLGILIDLQHHNPPKNTHDLAKGSQMGKRNAQWIELAKTLIKNDRSRFLNSNGKPIWKRLAEELGRQGHIQGLRVGTVRDILRDGWEGEKA